MTTEMKGEGKNCEAIAKYWATSLNSFVNKLNMVENIDNILDDVDA